MSNNIEDIYIGDKYRTTNKKGGKLILFFIIILLLVLLGMGYAYWYINNYQKINAKQLFFNNFSNNNVKNIVSENVYADLIEKLINTDYESNSTMNFSSNIENEILEGLDVNKFTLNLKNQNNVNIGKIYTELGIVYSGNEALRIKMITDEDSIAIKDADKEIVNMYVGMHFDTIKNRFGINIDKDSIKNLKRIQKNELAKEDIEQFTTDLSTKIASMIPDEKFTIQDNIAISQNDTSIPVIAYNLNLSQEEFKNLLIEVLKNIRNNETFLKKISTEEVKSEVGNKIIDVDTNFSNTIENEQEESFNEEQYNEGEEQYLEPISAEINEFNEPQIYEDENIDYENNEENYYNEDENIEDNDFDQNENFEEERIGNQELQLMRNTDNNIINENENLETLEKSEEYLEIAQLLLGMKINKSLKEITDLFDDCIENAKELTGNGISITVYASSEKTEKISITLPNENTVEIENLKKSDSNNKLKITYLYENLTGQKDGLSVQINKTNTTSNTSADVSCSFIENEKINKKINIQSEIEGSVNSNSLKYNLIITVSTNENETKFVSETDFKFSKNPEIEELNEENCLFLETLSEEEYYNTIEALKNQIDMVWKSKKENFFDFIDTNQRNLLVTTPTNPLSDRTNDTQSEEQLPEEDIQEPNYDEEFE